MKTWITGGIIVVAVGLSVYMFFSPFSQSQTLNNSSTVHTPQSESNSSTTKTLFILGGIVVAGAIAYKLYKSTDFQSKDSVSQKYEKADDSKEKYIKEFKEKLEKIEEKYKKDFLAYAMYNKANKYGLEYSVKEKIKAEYGRVISMPIVDFIEDLGRIGSRFKNEAIVEYLKEKGYKIDNSKDPKQNFRYYLLEKAEKQAEEEIKKFM